MSEQVLPEIELFIKASFDKEKKGGCPMCHQWFMAFYCMAERGYFNLTVTTIALESPPAYFSELNTSGRIPAVLIKSGLVNNTNLEAMVCSTYDEVENFMKMFGCAEFKTSRESKGIADAESVFLDLYGKFNSMLKNGNQAPLNKVLKKIDSWLEKEWSQQEGQHNKFLLSDDLTYADVQLIPKLQHVRVAGKFFNDFDINPSLRSLWKYLEEVYKTDVFQKTCPTDQAIVKFYQDKVHDGMRKTIQCNTQASCYTFSIPCQVTAEHTDNGESEANGASVEQTTGAKEDVEQTTGAKEEETAVHVQADEPHNEETSDPQPSEAQPSDPQPSEAQPSQAEPSEPQPSEAEQSDPQPSEDQPSEDKPADPQLSDVQPSEDQPCEDKPTDPQPSDAQLSEDQSSTANNE